MIFTAPLFIVFAFPRLVALRKYVLMSLTSALHVETICLTPELLKQDYRYRY